MFKKRQKTKADAPEIATSYPLFTFSVIDKGMQVAARDYSAIKAYAAVQQKGQSAKLVAPAPIPVTEPDPVPSPAPTSSSTVKPPKKRLVSRFVLLSGLFVFLAAALGGGVLLWTLRKNPSTDIVTIPPTTTTPTPPTTTPPTTTTPDITPVAHTEEQGKDTDSDGLSDAEERLFGTDIRNPDTDGDTYLDNNEVFHGYDPTVPAPSSLADSKVAKWYAYAGTPAFKFLKLNAWIADVPTIVPEGSKGSLRIITTTGAEFRFSLRGRQADQTVGDWYDAQTTWKEKYGNAKDLVPYASKQGYFGLITPDKRVAFLAVGNDIAVFEYDLKTERTVDYIQTFQMMLNSFQLVK